MARLRDFSLVTRRIGFIGYWKRVWVQCNEDGIFTWASALAYSWLFAVFPFLVFLLSLTPYIPEEGKTWIENDLGGVLEKALPHDAYKTVWEGFLSHRLRGLLHERPKGFLTIGLALTIWGASGGMAMTIRALDKCYDLDKGRPFYGTRLLAILLTFIIATLLLIVVVMLPVATTARSWAQNYLSQTHAITVPAWAFVSFEIVRYALALACMFLAVGILYFFGPAVKQRFRIFTPGSVFCVLVWLGLGSVFRLYVNTFGKYEQTYGPVGGVVILLLFFYLDAVVLLIGAEINSEIDFIAMNVKPGERDFRGKPWAHLAEQESRNSKLEIGGNAEMLEAENAKRIDPIV